MAIDWYVSAKAHNYASPEGMLHDMYHVQGMTIQLVADKLIVSTWAVKEALIRFGIEVRPQGGRRVKRRK